MKILFVCIGNICRSPIAEGIMLHLTQNHYLNWQIDSAATHSYHIGNPPHLSSQKVCQMHKIDISNQRAMLFEPKMIYEYDIIFCMADDVFRNIKQISGNDWDDNKVKLITNEIPNFPHSSVPDPYYGDFSDFESTYDIIQELCVAIIKNNSVT